VTLYQVKEQGVLDTPVFLFDCTFSDGTAYHWSSYHVTVQQTEYVSRVVKTNVFDMQASSDGGVDTIPKISLELANVDGLMSELQNAKGFKGASILVSFVFYNLAQDTATTDTLPIFQGILDSPESISETTFRVSAINRLSLQRIALPPVQIQSRCPWQFPTTPEQRQQAVNGGTAGCFSPFYNCGYSPDVPLGCGNLNNGTPFTTCDYSRTQCEQRGMFSTDSAGRITACFGGIEFVPPVISVRASGDKSSQLSVVQDNVSRYSDFVPLIYGTGWYYPGIVFARNDGNLTHFEILLGCGQMTSVSTVLVNDIEIPAGRPNTNMTGTGWYNVVTYGTRNGVFNMDFTDGAGHPLGDPYGSMAYMQLVVPNSINDGRSVPTIELLINGLQIETFGTDGASQGFHFCNNPVWIILDILRRSGWTLDEIDLPGFASAAAYCDEPIQATDLNGNATSIARFQCNLILQSRRSAGDVIRCIRNGARLYLTYSSTGLLQIKVENTLALQQPQPAPNSNAVEPLNGGWPVYEFGDGTNGTTGIARAGDQSSTFRVMSRSSADTPNRFSVECQDAFNSYQQDSVTLVNPDDVQSCGFQVSATPTVVGVPNYNQAARIVALCLNKSIDGNLYIEFQTSVRALGILPGDLVAITYAREGFDRTPFRVVKVSPGQNFRRALIRAQLHDDAWYTDTTANSLFNSSPLPSYQIGVPRPIEGVVLDTQGCLQFAVSETSSQGQDGTVTLSATAGFSSPPPLPLAAPPPPLVSLIANVSATGGNLQPNAFYYYALTSVDGNGNEGAPSLSVLAATSFGPATYSVTLQNLSLPSTAATFNVYRGSSPSQLLQISSNNTPASTFTDTGLPCQPYLPPDANYDHANFYWRLEAQPSATVTIFSANTIGNNTTNMAPNQYAGMTVRILAGTGAYQERVVASNTATTLTVSKPWTITPDTSSTFAISQTGYQFGASSSANDTNQVQFTIPNSPGATIQICGRSANVYDVESSYDLSTVTRWQIGGAGINPVDSGVPPLPVFGLNRLPEGGGVELGGVGVQTLDNTRTISLGTLTLYYYDESSTAAPPVLAGAMSSNDSTLTLSPKPTYSYPQYLAVDQEVMRITGPSADGNGFAVDRAVDGTNAAAHDSGAVVLPLTQVTASYPILEDFFGSAAAGTWTQSIVLANARICAAEFFFTNSQGNGPVAAHTYTNVVGGGLRTFTGGQIVLQVPGFLAVQNGAVPPLDPGATYSVRDVYAYVGTAPTSQATTNTNISLQVLVGGQPYCSLTIAAGATQTSASIEGSTLPVLRAGGLISLNILSVCDATPGSDLTVVIRV
jgi:hypothetical protein